MNGADECRAVRQALGVYVLGATDPTERALVEAHLSRCAGCREELASLESLPTLLRRVPATEAERLLQDGHGAPPDDRQPAGGPRRPPLGDGRRHGGLGWRRLASAAALVVVSAVAGAAAWPVLRDAGASRPQPAASARAPWADGWHVIRGSNPGTVTSAAVRFAWRPWGTDMRVQVLGVPPGTVCQLWVTDSAGRRSVAGGWTVPHHPDSAWYPGSTSLAGEDMRSLEITAGGKLLVTVKGPFVPGLSSRSPA